MDASLNRPNWQMGNSELPSSPSGEGKGRHYATMVYVKTPEEAVHARRHLENKQQQKQQICQCITCIQPKTAEEARQALFH